MKGKTFQFLNGFCLFVTASSFSLSGMKCCKGMCFLLKHTVMILNFQTDRSAQTVQTQSQGLHCLLFHLHVFDKMLLGLASLYFR